MSVFVGLRLPEDVASAVDHLRDRGMGNRSQVIIAALRSAFELTQAAEKKPAELRRRSTPAKSTKPPIKTLVASIPTLKPASSLPTPSSAYQRPAHAVNCRCLTCTTPH